MDNAFIVTGLRYTRQGSLKVELNGEYIGEVDPLVFEFSVGDELSKEEADAARDLARRFSAQKKALGSLAVTSYSKAGLKRKLIQKGVEPQIADESVEYFSAKGYIDDNEYAKNKAAVMHSRKNFGRRRIRFELMKLGVGGDTVDQVIESLPPDIEALRRILSDFDKDKLIDRAEMNRFWQRSMRQGFYSDDIREALSEVSDEDYYDE